MKNYKRNLAILLTAFGIFAAVCVYGLIKLNAEPKNATTKHSCNWEDCEHLGDTVFVIKWNNTAGSMGEKCERLHFDNPNLTYEQCELLSNNN